jgi:PIN domain nuclease of toxin-antitoxin system
MKLSDPVKQTILDPASEKHVSMASAWEFAIKVSTGKMVGLDGGVSEFFKIIKENGFGILPIKEENVKRLETLPFIHRDPFDRMLVAVAKAENMTILSADENIHQYDVP